VIVPCHPRNLPTLPRTLRSLEAASSELDVERIVIEDRTGGGVRVRVTTGVLVERQRTPGVIRQNFFSSPRLREWFENHDALIDARIEMAERAEYERLCRESAAYRARKAAQKKARAV